MTDFLQGPMLQSNAVVQTTSAGIFGNLSVTDSTLPSNGLYLPAANTLSLATNNTRVLTVNSAGSVGIGSSIPAYQLDVVGTVRATSGVLLNNNTNLSWFNGSGVSTTVIAVNSVNELRFYSPGNTLYINPDSNQQTAININNSTPVLIGNGSAPTNLNVQKGNVNISGNCYVTTLNTLGSNILSITGTVVSTTTQQGGRAYEAHDFNSYPNLYSTIFINPGASVNNPASLSGNGYRFVMGAGDTSSRGFDLVGTSGGQLYYRARETGTWYLCTATVPSDYRLKTDISPMTSGMLRLAQLRPSIYTLRESGTRQEGFIAHELQEIVPEAVLGTKDDINEDGTPRHQSIDYTKLVPLLVTAIQELKAEFDAYKAAHP